MWRQVETASWRSDGAFYCSGSFWGYAGPLIIVGRHPREDEYYLSFDTEDGGVICVGRDPLWPGQKPDVYVPLADPDLYDKREALLE